MSGKVMKKVKPKTNKNWSEVETGQKENATRAFLSFIVWI